MNNPALDICNRHVAEARARVPIADPAPDHFRDADSEYLKTCLIFVDCKRELFWPDFEDWLKANFSIYREFERRALALWKAGRRHYGHRSLWEVVRYETALAQTDGEFRLNDHYTKSVARLFIMTHQMCDGLFEFRQSMGDR